MTEAEHNLIADRANRQAARGLFNSALAQVKTDLAARGIAGRIRDTITDEADQTVHHAIDVARANKGVVAGTIAALGLWIFRNPLIAGVRHLFGGGQAADHQIEPDEEHEP